MASGVLHGSKWQIGSFGYSDLALNILPLESVIIIDLRWHCSEYPSSMHISEMTLAVT
jgi:hypothetical protein